jgi:hypothetical protein
VFDAATKPNWTGAVPAPGDLLGPPIKVRPPGPSDDFLHRARGNSGGPGHRSPLVGLKIGYPIGVVISAAEVLALSLDLQLHFRLSSRSVVAGPCGLHTNQTAEQLI